MSPINIGVLQTIAGMNPNNLARIAEEIDYYALHMARGQARDEILQIAAHLRDKAEARTPTLALGSKRRAGACLRLEATQAQTHLGGASIVPRVSSITETGLDVAD